MSSITKGEWEIVISHAPREPKEIVIGVGIREEVEGGTYFTMVCNSLLPETDAEYIEQHDNILSDMRLIAAAPDLLREAKRAYSELEKHSNKYVQHRAAKLKEAINKATNGK